MIEDVKWLKPEDYKKTNKGTICWIAKDGVVRKGYLNISGHFFGSFNAGRVAAVKPDGVCIRNKNQQPPVLR